MVKFAKKLAAAQRTEWHGHYLEYKQLKKKLKDVLAATRGLDGQEASAVRAQDGFQRALDSEVERVVLFFLTKQGEFAKTLSTLREQQTQLSEADLEAMHQLADAYRRVGDELVHLLLFVELNATGIRKILKKHDKMMKESKIMGTYLSSRTDSQASHLQQLYHDEGISAIIASIRRALSELRRLQVQLAMDAETRHLAIVRTISEDEPVLSRINIARHRLHQSTQYVTTVAAKALIFDDESEEDEEAVSSGYIPLRPRRKVSGISRFINMFNTFLYMTNYYIVAPTSGQYASKLGAEAALSGIIVGMTPIASLLSAVLYSWWANRSYKAPLCFATVCLVVGNLLYGFALYYKSITMVMAGRLLNGLGGARAINRRYIADNYSREERTQGSAMFVTASALGMAAGPAMAAAFDSLPNFKVYNVPVTTETIPGFVMCVLWLVYLVATMLWFVEPDRYDRERRQSIVAMEDGVAALTERTALIQNSPAPGKTAKLSALWHNVPVVATLLIYLVLKTVVECQVVASSTIARYYFGWHSIKSGLYLAALGLLMFPTNMIVSWLSYRYEDRELVIFSEIFMVIGTFMIVNYGHYTALQFMAGGVVIFVSTNVLEGVNMSLLSKKIPKAYARGTFNSGLLATEAGTSGRAVGDIAITLAGLQGLQYVLNWTFVPLIVTSVLTLLGTLRYYAHLADLD